MSSQFSKSRERWIGMPGRYSKLDVARNHSSPTFTTEGSGWKPLRSGLYRVVTSPLSEWSSGQECAEIARERHRTGICAAGPRATSDRPGERQSGVGVDARQ